jgi:hypothetical protein
MFSKGEVREFFVVGRSWIDAVVIRKVREDEVKVS